MALPTPNSFLSLDTDSLARILQYLPAQCIALLWMCGDSLLLRRLTTHGAVRSFILELEPRPFIKWPSLIQHFTGLEILAIKFVESSDTVALADVDISTIPKSVRTIDFDFGNDFLSFLEIAPVDIELDTSHNSDGCQMKVLKDILPNLTSLSVSDKGKCDSLAPNFVTHLPSELQHLNLPKSSHLSMDMIGALPRFLHTLNIYELKQSPNHSLFPETLTSFRCQEVFDDNLLDSLPLGLLLLQLGTLREQWPIETCKKLSRFGSLQTLIFNPKSFDEEFLDTLPMNLAELQSGNVAIRNVETLKAASRKLKVFSVWTLSVWTIPVAVALKAAHPSWKSLPRHFSIFVAYSDWPSVPRHLLEFSSGAYQVPNQLISLPPRLTSLTMQQMVICDVQHLPATLTNLSFHAQWLSDRTKSFASEITLKGIYNPVTDRKELEKKVWARVRRSFSYLSHLKQLSMTSDHLLPNTIFSCLPPSLTSLYAPFPTQNLCEIDFEANGWYDTMEKLCLRTTVSEPETLYAHLPRSLTSLELESPQNAIAYYSNKGFMDLPRILRQLRIQALESLEDSHFKAIPPTIRRLELLSLSYQLTEEGLNALPRSLTFLALPAAPQVPSSYWEARPLLRVKLFLDGMWDERFDNPAEGPYNRKYLSFPAQ